MATRHYFGTDGIRGRVGTAPITADFVLKLGWAVGRALAKQEMGGRVIIGKDTRLSGYMFESAFEAGLTAAGMNVLLLGPMPTPAVAYLTRTFHADVGIVISASHNPHYDNGFKFFSSEGTKLSDEVEALIESYIEREMKTVAPENVGKVMRVDDAPGRYIEYCKGTISHHMNFKGLKLVLDCAHGATYHIAPEVFFELGAEVVSIGDQPNGMNINKDAGSTNPDCLKEAVLSNNADLGIAFDGDGDRVIMVDHEGRYIDGDELLYVIAMQAHKNGMLKGGVVGTLMTNLGIEKAFEAKNIPFVRSKVGDRYVLGLMQNKGWCLGGESSGHIISLRHSTTGDGIVAALQVMSAMVENGQTLSELLSDAAKMPQVLINVPLKKKLNKTDANRISEVSVDIEKELGSKGRVLIRPSGTEPLLRVMVEGEDDAQINQTAKALEKIVLDMVG